MLKYSRIIVACCDHTKLSFLRYFHRNMYRRPLSNAFGQVEKNQSCFNMDSQPNSAGQGNAGNAYQTPVHFVDNFGDNREWKPVSS